MICGKQYRWKNETFNSIFRCQIDTLNCMLTEFFDSFSFQSHSKYRYGYIVWIWMKIIWSINANDLKGFSIVVQSWWYKTKLNWHNGSLFWFLVCQLACKLLWTVDQLTLIRFENGVCFEFFFFRSRTITHLINAVFCPPRKNCWDIWVTIIDQINLQPNMPMHASRRWFMWFSV